LEVKDLKKVLLAVVFISFSFTINFAQNIKTPKEVVENFIQNLSENKIDEAIKLLSVKEFEGFSEDYLKVNFEIRKSFLRQIAKEKFCIEKISIEKETDEVYLIKVIGKNEAKETKQMLLKLVKENNEWKISAWNYEKSQKICENLKLS
jgi:hypothetical protein